MNQMHRELPQEFDRLLWGTLMPVQVRLGSEIVSIRARGTFRWRSVIPNFSRSGSVMWIVFAPRCATS
jgi:hypothetical protein